ncbi:hypothetical protein JNW90_01450 [Micromonospora sp. STR1s_5]|nr:hypothetical protein [Micromonospora sp. STR1s_5]
MTSPNNIVQAKRVKLWLGPTGSTVPTGLEAPTGGILPVGLTNPESCRFRTSPEFEPVNAHQSDFPVKILQTGDAAGMDVDLLEWTGANFKSVYGGGAISAVSGGPPNLYKFTPPGFGDRDEVLAILDVFDGAKTYRFIAPRVFNQSEVELELNKTPETKLPLRLTILGGDDVDAWYMLTNDASFAPVSP